MNTNWKRGKGESKYYISDEEGTEIIRIYRMGNQEQIMRLVLAAPDMYEALRNILKSDERRMYTSCPDCDYEDYCNEKKVCKSMPLSHIGKTAEEALKKADGNER